MSTVGTGPQASGGPYWLLLSNGHGEDAIAARLAVQLASLGAGPLAAFPLVGRGRAYQAAGVPVVGVQAEMPSGGFVRAGAGILWRDVRHGLLGLFRRQLRSLRSLRTQVGCTIAVGDVLVLALAAWAVGRPLAFFATAKSDYIQPHYRWEVALMRTYARLVLTRDEVTARSLRAQGVPARYAGNPMMDLALAAGPSPWQLPAGCPVVALMPGSRVPEAYANLHILLAAAAALGAEAARRGDSTGSGAGQPPAQPFLFLLPLAEGLDRHEVARRAAAAGWSWQPAPAGVPEWGRLLRPGAEVRVVPATYFPHVLAAARVAIGMAGTANEQAAGCGVPVVAPAGQGPQFTARFLARQARLLGDAVWPVAAEPAQVAAAVRRLLEDPGEHQRRAQVGRERMGPPGAAARCAAVLYEALAPTVVTGAGSAAGPSREG